MGPTRKNILPDRNKYFSKLVLTKIIKLLYIFDMKARNINYVN